MNRDPQTTDDSWETDAVWKLLDQAPPQAAGPRFADDTLRAVRLLPEVKPWWSRLLSPAPLTGLAGAAAAVVFLLMTNGPAPEKADNVASASYDSPQAVAIQHIAETEILIAAADQLDDFSDNELVSLIGF